MTTYIYGLFDPRSPSKIIYIGQTTMLSARITQHILAHDKRTKQWVTELKAEHISPAHRILAETDEYNALAVEANHIKQHLPRLNVNRDGPEFRFEVSPIVSLRDLQSKYIRWSLDFFGGNKQATAKALGLGRQTLYNKLKAMGIE